MGAQHSKNHIPSIKKNTSREDEMITQYSKLSVSHGQYQIVRTDVVRFPEPAVVVSYCRSIS